MHLNPTWLAEVFPSRTIDYNRKNGGRDGGGLSRGARKESPTPDG